MKSRFTQWFASRGRSGAPGWKLSRGQSLVEMALTMPLLLLILAGTVEVTNLLTIYNQLQLGVREGTRLAAQGAPDTTVMGVINDALRETAVVTAPEYMKVWVVRPTLNTAPNPWVWAGGSTNNWGADVACITKAANGIDPNCDPEPSPVTPSMILNQLSTINNSSLNKEVFVVLTAKYEAQTILNLKWFGSPTGRFPIYAYNVYRQEVTAKTQSQFASGCTAYPIAINYDSITDLFVEGQSWALPRNNLPGSRDGFGFLLWYGPTGSPGDLALSMGVPGNSLVGVPATNTKYYRSAYDPTNTQLRRGGWVWASNGTIADVSTQLQNHYDQKRTLRVIAYNPDAPVATTETANADPTVNGWNPDEFKPPKGVANKYAYQIADFVVVRLFTPPAGSTLWLEYVKKDASCGFPK